MNCLLSAEFEARAHGAQVNVGAGGFAGHGLAEGEIGDVILGEVMKQPDAFGLVGVNGDVYAAGMVETEGAVYGGFAHGADRQRLAELVGEGGFDAGEGSGVKGAVAVET